MPWKTIFKKKYARKWPSSAVPIYDEQGKFRLKYFSVEVLNELLGLFIQGEITFSKKGDLSDNSSVNKPLENEEERGDSDEE